MERNVGRVFRWAMGHSIQRKAFLEGWPYLGWDKMKKTPFLGVFNDNSRLSLVNWDLFLVFSYSGDAFTFLYGLAYFYFVY